MRELSRQKGKLGQQTVLLQASSLMIKVWLAIRLTNHPISKYILLGGEDFRTALQNATNYIKDLESISRSESSQSSPLPSASSSKINQSTPIDPNIQRIDTMAKLIEILRRHMRVRYELNFDEILHAYVSPSLICVSYAKAHKSQRLAMFCR